MYIKEYPFNNKSITVYITRKKIKHLYLRVRADNRVTLSAPLNIEEQTIDHFVESRMDWIISHILDYDSETEVLLFGKKYAINTVIADKDSVFIIDDTITIHLTRSEDKERLLKNFLEKKLNHLLHSYSAFYSALMNIEFPHTYAIKPMKARWGANYTKKRHIVYNSELLHQPTDFIEYVVAHELSHFKYQNHSKDFYQYLSQFMPDYKIKRKRRQ